MLKSNICIKDAIKRTEELFPFEGYILPQFTNEKGVYDNIANIVLHHLNPGDKILDFGSGPCDKTAVLQFLGFSCSAYDDLKDNWHGQSNNEEKIISFIQKCGIDFKQSNGGQLPFDKGSFDMVMLHDVLEHLHDSPRDLLNDLLELLKPEGFIFITVPNAVNIRKRFDVLLGNTNHPPFDSFYWYPGQWRGHVREYVKNDLIQLADYLNLEILKLGSCDHMLEKVPSGLISAYLFVTGFFQGWKDTWLLVARKRKDWVPIKTRI